jgi:FixJ family two-component response regulator
MTEAQPVAAVVDDEPEMRKAIRRLLATRGIRVEEYERGEEFLAALGSRPLYCVLLDLHMPGVNGFQVLESLSIQRSRVPVIVITAHDEPGTAERVRVLGACAYLKKPVERNDLFAAIAGATPLFSTGS